MALPEEPEDSEDRETLPDIPVRLTPKPPQRDAAEADDDPQRERAAEPVPSTPPRPPLT